MTIIDVVLTRRTYRPVDKALKREMTALLSVPTETAVFKHLFAAPPFASRARAKPFGRVALADGRGLLLK